ncbi:MULTISPECIES: hypothetical protein [unclassified Nostoc]|uniref:hypothetical protein n=1 Tax=unclassified Nostoc TaxID=2593658 RepID=UPI002AD4C1D5|nr:hypothetical protein [Nostoc sp. DedQUE03]MDZ7974030.1 hypothetical protein [Nostoc sp. DedQUE03]MDZ8048531.1 hypothetical protein [Nostoc sp. DedQUE02]
MTCTRTITTLNAGFTQAQLSAALQTAFANAGFSSLFDSFTSGTDLCLVYAFTTDATKTYGITYIRIRITTGFVIYQQPYGSWNTSTHTGTGTGTGTEINYGTLVNTVNVIFNSLTNGNEARLVCVNQGSTFLLLGAITPSILRGSWDLNSYTASFIPNTNTLTSIIGTIFNQYYSISTSTSMINTLLGAGSALLAGANIVDLQRDILTGVPLLNNTNGGFLGQLSSDFAICASNGSTRYDVIVPTGTSQQYLVIVPGSGGIAVRIN